MNETITEGNQLLGSLSPNPCGSTAQIHSNGSPEDAVMGDEGAHLKRSYSESNTQPETLEQIRGNAHLSSLARAAAESRGAAAGGVVLPAVSNETAGTQETKSEADDESVIENMMHLPDSDGEA